MKTFIGLMLVIAGAIIGLYAGVWVCFIGGIVDVITEIRAPELEAIHVAIGIAKVFFASFIGWVCFMVFALPGYGMIKLDE